MIRNLPHFLLRDLGAAEPFGAKGGGGDRHTSNVPNRVAHAQALLRALDALPGPAAIGASGLYLEVDGRAGETLRSGSLGSSGISLLHYDAATGPGQQEKATVFATERGIANLRGKVADFEVVDTAKGRPKNADLVQSIAAISEAGLRALWRSPTVKFPEVPDAVVWEVWLEPDRAEEFAARAREFGVVVGGERLRFPEDIVILVQATRDVLAAAVRRLTAVRALAMPSSSAAFFDGLDSTEQAHWVQDLQKRVVHRNRPDPGYVTILDTGISLAHPLIQPALHQNDRYTADPAWGLEDLRGHGTEMAGLALYGDLSTPLQLPGPPVIDHRLESVKVVPDAGYNLHHLLGAVTRSAVNAVEALGGQRRRTFMMASTTSDDTPHDGAPTSWSSEIDQLAAGASGAQANKRLILISAGNTETNAFGAGNYLETCEEHELESPAQAWNAISVGAFTEKHVVAGGIRPLAPFGDLSPSSRTASWSSTWPIKPDVVLEGGNWAVYQPPPPMRHPALALLTTSASYPRNSFRLTYDTSAATALAAKQVTELWSDYPHLWPETIRALYVSSARWTPQMLSHLPAVRQRKEDFAPLFRRYGYGIPDMERAARSAGNALTLIIEDSIIPYKLSERTGDDVHNQMKVATLPWPVDALRLLGNQKVTLRVALSTFVEPNPAEAARGSKYRYASHNLRFKLNRSGENLDRFRARISALAEAVDGPANIEEDDWDFGRRRRDVGSLHIDQLVCRASDLARRRFIAVHPVAGWWKAKARLKEELPTVRYALIVEIDAGNVDVDLYTEVRAAVAALAPVIAVGGRQ